ncbi:hypothetical protein Leryth_016329 [Lithospermum erythrorhizon]|nr:hypothetical protein Leryth_016329 [Lithospermum erythrorhizon]
MASDSDSDASHISATPPRHHHPPPPLSTKPTTLKSYSRPTLLPKSLTKNKKSTPSPLPSKKNYSRPILLPNSLTKKKKSTPTPPPTEPSPVDFQSQLETPIAPPPISTNLPFKIRKITSFSEPLLPNGLFVPNCLSYLNQNNVSSEINVPKCSSFFEVSNKNPIFEPIDGLNVPKCFSFSEDKNKDPIFEPIDSINVPKCSSFLESKNKNSIFEPTDDDLVSPDVFSVDPKEVGNESFGENGNSEKVARVAPRFPNLIGSSNVSFRGNVGSSSSFDVKRPKCGNEGNFVRLNINGYGKKKFVNRGKGSRYSSSNSWSASRRFYKRSKRKSKGQGEGEESGLLDEEGSVVNLKGEKSSLDVDMEIIENAVTRVRDEASDENLVSLLKVAFGYDSFREGQLEAIKMVLSGKSTMLVLPTGAGKSLCYQLPALVLPGVTLVVSPLIALMIDQLKKLCPAIPGCLLSSSQTFEEAAETLKLLQEGEIKVLFVSPERLLNAKFVSIFSNTPISLVVVDEAHCVSEWSHNFRPSYMRVRASLLRTSLNAECILAMTATATTKTLHDVMHALEIPPLNLIQSAQLRDNLHLSVSISKNRMKDLITLVKSPPFSEAKSIIIYCKFQHETDTISKYLCDGNITAKSYHGGIPAKDRSRIQERFCSNKLRVVVATVAFGMGLDKSDIGAVIHYSLPESLEEYVQEIGRAGRDGRLSYCHLFFDDVTFIKLRSLMCSDGVDEYAVNKFLSQVFHNGSNLPEVCSITKESAARKFDMKEEVLLTILTQLEMGGVQYLQLLPQMNVTCTINFHQTSPAVLATKDKMVAAILNKAEKKDGQYVFDIPSMANSMRVQPMDISNHLLNLKFKREITYELKDQAFCYTIVDIPKDICSLAAQLTKWLSEVESCKVQKLDAMYNAAIFAVKECNKLHGCCDSQHTYCMQKNIVEYFSKTADCDITSFKSQNSPFLRADIKVFLQSNAQAKFSPRAIARIMHGLASPAFPSATWSKTHFWGRYMQTDFKLVMEAAKAELISFLRKDAPVLVEHS